MAPSWSRVGFSLFSPSILINQVLTRFLCLEFSCEVLWFSILEISLLCREWALPQSYISCQYFGQVETTIFHLRPAFGPPHICNFHWTVAYTTTRLRGVNYFFHLTIQALVVICLIFDWQQSYIYLYRLGKSLTSWKLSRWLPQREISSFAFYQLSLLSRRKK